MKGSELPLHLTGHPLVPIDVDIVTVQSQLVYGYVGNSIALPALQSHGLNVVAVPTVILSNTPHYPSMHGGALPSDWFEGYLDDLTARGALAGLGAILVGYMGNPQQMSILARWISRIRLQRPEVLVIVDPVIGDDDVGIHVAPGMIEAWRAHLLHGDTRQDVDRRTRAHCHLAQGNGRPVQRRTGGLPARGTGLAARGRTGT